MPFMPLPLDRNMPLDNATRSETSASSEQSGGGVLTGFLPTKSRSFVRITELSVVNSTGDNASSITTTRSQSQRLWPRLPLDQCGQHTSTQSLQHVNSPFDVTVESIRRQLLRHLQLPLPLRLTVTDHGNQIDESRRLNRQTNDGFITAKTTTSPVFASASNKRRRFSVDNCSSTGRPCRRLDQRRSTTPLSYQVVLDLRLARPSVTATSVSIEDARSPRVLRHICALNSPGKRHWTPVERLCCEVRATEEDYVDDLRRLIEGFFAPLADRAADADIHLGPLSELHTATRFLLRVHEELLAQMSSERIDWNGNSVDGGADVAMSIEVSTGRREYVGSGDAHVGSDDGEDALDSDGDVAHPNQSGHETLGGLRDPPVSVNQIAKAFVSTAQYMKAYAIYCAAHRPATDELNALQKKHPRLFLDLDASAPVGAAGLTFPEVLSELIKPVQRICRYPMLLRSLVDLSTTSSVLTANDPSDVTLLREALDAIERVSDLVNARVRDAQNNTRLLELFVSLPVSGQRRATRAKIRLLRPARAFVCEACAAVQVTRVAPRWRWLRKWSSLLLRMRLPHCLRRQTSDDEAVDPRESNMCERLAECEHCERASCVPPSPCSSGDLHDGPGGMVAAGTGGREEQSRLILLSDVMLMAKKCDHKLQVRRQICLSCATVSEIDPDGHKEATLVLQAAKVGRCHCHQLTPATLQRPLLARRSSSASVSLVGSSPDLPTPSVVINTVAAIGSNNFSSRDGDQGQPSSARWRRASSLPLRASRRYLLRFASVEAKSEFAAQLRHTIVKCARVEPPPPPVPRSYRSSSRSSKRLVARRLWRSLTHPELVIATAATAVTSTTRATTPDATVRTQADNRLLGRRRQRCASLATAISCRGEVDESVVSSVDSLDTADAALVSVGDSHDDHGDFV